MLATGLRRRITTSATGPFGHAPYPLADTMDHAPDPGLFGPGSVSWRVIGNTTAFVGGIRGLLVQAAHPEVVAGVADHSRYRDDPLGRLSRTSSYVTATTYGAMPEVEEAIQIVRRAHRRVEGVSHRGIAYAAGDPGHAAWVHNALTDSFLRAYQTYAADRLDEEEADRFVAEQAEIGRRLDGDPLPTTAAELGRWVAGHPDIGPSPGMAEAVEFLIDPPALGPGQKLGYRGLLRAAVAITPERIRSVLALQRRPTDEAVGRTTVAGLRWALGASPSWRLALARTGSPEPEGLFVQPLPTGSRRSRGAPR